MQQLRVNPIGVQNVAGVAGSNAHPVYPARIVFPQAFAPFAFGSVVGVDLTAQGQPNMPLVALVGRDILSRCVLIYNGTNGTFTLALN